MSPRTPLQFEEMREEKKTLIMDTALEHFANEGYKSTTINHIAKHAGISKGLMYNYFESKEKLLSEIVERSLGEISRYFDPDQDGYLSEEEFELFVRKSFFLLKEKLSFWRLFYQLLMQKDVRDQFLKSDVAHEGSAKSVKYVSSSSFFSRYNRMITSYFVRKKERKPADYDPMVDLNMFIYTTEGFFLVTAYLDKIDDAYFDKIVDKIIELYK
jgi:AcrR family transcriptional regulator